MEDKIVQTRIHASPELLSVFTSGNNILILADDTGICLVYIHVFSLQPSEILQRSKRAGFHTVLPSILSKMLPREKRIKTESAIDE